MSENRNIFQMCTFAQWYVSILDVMETNAHEMPDEYNTIYVHLIDSWKKAKDLEYVLVWI